MGLGDLGIGGFFRESITTGVPPYELPLSPTFYPDSSPFRNAIPAASRNYFDIIHDEIAALKARVATLEAAAVNLGDPQTD